MSETKKKSVFEVMSAVDVSPYLFEKISNRICRGRGQ